jgi:hypothetical protein
MDTIIKEALIDKIFKADSKKSIPQNIHEMKNGGI